MEIFLCAYTCFNMTVREHFLNLDPTLSKKIFFIIFYYLGMITILQRIHHLAVKHIDSETPERIVFGGDVLTNERAFLRRRPCRTSPLNSQARGIEQGNELSFGIRSVDVSKVDRSKSLKVYFSPCSHLSFSFVFFFVLLTDFYCCVLI